MERRGYPRPPTPARASFCPSAADDAASCSSTDTSSTLTDFSEPDAIPVVAAPCESPPLLGPVSCRGGRLSSDLWSSVPESGGSTRGAPIPLCHRSLNSALSGCPAPAAKMMAAPRPQQPHGMKLAEMKKATVVGRRKVTWKLEDVHQLRLLDNRYIQYRLLNTRGHRRPGPRLLRRRTPCSDWLRELLGYENQLLIRGQRLRRSRGIRDCAQLLVVRTSVCRSYLKKGLTIWLNVPLDALARMIAAVGSASRHLLHQQSGDPYAKVYNMRALPVPCKRFRP